MTASVTESPVAHLIHPKDRALAVRQIAAALFALASVAAKDAKHHTYFIAVDTVDAFLAEIGAEVER